MQHASPLDNASARSTSSYLAKTPDQIQSKASGSAQPRTFRLMADKCSIVWIQWAKAAGAPATVDCRPEAVATPQLFGSK